MLDIISVNILDHTSDKLLKKIGVWVFPYQ